MTEEPEEETPSDLPKQKTLHIVNLFNKKDITTVIERYCSKDYVFECTQPNGSILTLDRTQMQNLREWYTPESKDFRYFHEYTPNAHAEIRSVATSVERESATIWLTILMHNDNHAGQAREKLSIFSWRLEADETGEKKWMWWKEYTSAGVVSFDQTSEAT
ncbi:hypothetical protein PRZ48_009187 [Zasmidium cellare]|uniref:SnoaL-like domain-containing protein n=1 Tax=Zasmidium cellare TaxID=395010 RepID=A0ABR0EB21_ZASCE|nr:hypothetical protein PRZ48_009187 [Zasmidium cellare]